MVAGGPDEHGGCSARTEHAGRRLPSVQQSLRSGKVSSVDDYVAEAVRLRLAKDRALAQITELFGGPPPDDVAALVRQRAGLPPRHAAS